MENNIAGIPIEDLKPLAVKYEGDDSFESLQKVALKISVANCARISYQTLGDNPVIDYKADLRLHDMLVESKHWSPLEHIARVMTDCEYESYYKGDGANIGHTGLQANQGWCNNFKGFVQYRKIMENE